MAEAQKGYPYAPVMLYNLTCDIVEMYKAKITENKSGRVAFTTEMYGQKTSYLFRIDEQADGCLLSIEIPEDEKQAEKQISFMFSLVDIILAHLPK